MRRHFAVPLAVLGLLPAAAAAQHFTQSGKLAAVSPPVAMDTTNMFQAAIAHVGDDMFIGGQPTERALRELKAQGVTTVVNLRTPPEMTRSVHFDEAALVASLGMNYVTLPVRGDTAFPYSPEVVAKFSKAVSQTKGKVLLHCTIGWRASHLWAAYLIQQRGIPVEAALSNARAINLMDGMRNGPNARQPVEEFLGRALPTLGHPSP